MFTLGLSLLCSQILILSEILFLLPIIPKIVLTALIILQNVFYTLAQENGAHAKGMSILTGKQSHNFTHP